MEDMPGGFTPTRDATEDIQKFCDQVKGDVEKKTGKKYELFKAVKYRSQVVHGINYLVKVHVGGCSYLHVMIYRSLPGDGGEVALSNLQENHTEDDPLVPF